METKQWERIEELFHATLQLEAAERSGYLLRECLDDEALRREVESLITSFENSPAFINSPDLSLGMRVLSNESSDSMVGKSVGQYRIVSALGQGGMGEVYLAEDTKLGRKAALKFLSQEFVSDNWAKRQLIKEAQAVAILDHPNICPVYGIEEIGGHSFIVMQYVEGETLADLIRNHSLQANQIVPLAQQIVGAVAEAHAHGIIHRDIKPRNIMVTPSGQVKVLDFGLAKTIQQKTGVDGRDDSISHLSQNGLLAGTVAYMSPEQLRGEKLDYRSDIFGLGTVLYELTSGRNPFAQESTAETISAILTAQPPPLGNSALQVSRALDQITNKCLEKGLDQRYQAASELLHDLKNLQTGVKTDVRWRSYIHSRSISVVALLLLLLTIAGFVYSRMTRVYSLAVLPIVNETGPANDYLSLGLTDALTQKLSSLSKLRVKPLSTVSGYKANEVDLQSLGANLSVDALLLGRIVEEEGSLVLETTLVDSANGSQRRIGKNKLTSEVFTLPEEVSREVVNNLELWLGKTDSERLVARGTENPEAFRQYMLGRYNWKNRDKERIEKAIVHFGEAVRLDPLYAQAHAGLADCYVLLSIVAYGQMHTDEAMTKAGAAARDALEIDETLPEAYTSLGVIGLRYNWDWADTEKKFKRAIELKPDYAPAHFWYANLLIITGRPEQAIAESEIAKNLDPFSAPSTMNFCRTLAFARQYDRAKTCFDLLLKENPDYKIAQYMIGLIYQETGRREDAIAIFERLYESDKALAGAALGYAYGKAGRRRDALKILAEMNSLSKERYIPPQEFAIIYVGVGDNEKAFAWLNHAYRERFANLPYLTVDPLFSSLHSDPRFAGLVELLRLPMPH